MSKQTEALECLDGVWRGKYNGNAEEAITAIREALAEQPKQQEDPCIKCKGLGYYDEGHECDDGSMAGGNYVECDRCKQPDFIKHEVENAYDWSEWVCPDPESYLMKCCDCGLVHEAQFRVAKYKPAPSDECEVVSEPDLQAQFRMRRSEQWSPADTAHRPGGLPMAEQPAQQEVDWEKLYRQEVKKKEALAAKYERDTGKKLTHIVPMAEQPAQQQAPASASVEPHCYMDEYGNVRGSYEYWMDCEGGWFPVYTSPPAQRKPLTLGQKQRLWSSVGDKPTLNDRVNAYGLAIEAAHGIKEKNT